MTTNPMTALRDLIITTYPDLSLDDHLQITCDMTTDLLTDQRLISIPDDADDAADDFTDALCAIAALRDLPTSDDDITALARDTFCDPTESFHAAHIRDTCRDNPIAT